MIVVVASALITDANNNVLLVHENKVDKFGLPGGKLEEGESLSQCLTRELKEELGVTAAVKDLIYITQKPLTHENNTVIRFIYTAEIVSHDSEAELSYDYYDQAQVQEIVAANKLRGKDVEQLLNNHFTSTLTSIPQPELFT